MKYVGYFKDINDKSYRVELISLHDDKETKEIRLAEEPFTTTWSGNDENIYEPLRAGESTVRIITGEPLLDLYSPDAFGTSVTLYDDVTNEIQWNGYVEPQIYDQDWESEQDTLELNCLDHIAILQYIEYGTLTDGKAVCTFQDIFDKIFSAKSTSLGSIYYPNSLSYNSDTLTKFSISQHNFFDEDDESMKCDEVLEEICKYLNFTVLQFKNDIYFLDWDSIKTDSYICIRSDINNPNWNSSEILLKDHKVLNSQSYAGEGSTISLSPVYNKVTVKDDLYPVESIFPNLEDNIYNRDGKGFVHEIRTPYVPYAVTGKWNHLSYFQFFKNVHCTSYYYKMHGNLDDQSSLVPLWDTVYENPPIVDYNTLRGYIGGTLLAHKCENYDANKDDPSSLSLDTMLLLHVHDKQPNKDIPLFKVSYEGVEFYTGRQTYLIIKGNAVFLDDIDDKKDKGVSEMILDSQHSRKDDDFHLDRLYIEVVLKVNDKYWNGTNWNANYCTFKMPFQFEDKHDNHFIGSTIPIKNTVSWKDNIDSKGYKILMPAGQLNSNVEVQFLAPKQRIDNSYRLESIWVKDFDVEFKVASIENTNLITEKEEKSDTEYSNVINESFIKEMDEITFKVCTYDNKTPNYSSVYIGNEFAKYILHKGLGKRLRMEEHLIEKLVTQYSTPNTILDLILKNDYKPYSIYTTHLFPDKQFIVDSSTIDWEMNQTTLHLIEKK